jgi:uncharacterized protein (TIRG00374 family)
MSYLKAAIKVLLSILLLWLILRAVDLGVVSKKLEHARIDWLLAAVLVFGIQIGVLAYRWAIVSNILGSKLGPGPATRITFIAQFFNQALPSTVGGDAVRVWLVSRDGSSVRLAAHGVLADRAIATAMLLVFVVLGLPFQHAVLDAPKIQWVVNSLALGALAGFVLSLVVEDLLRKLWGKFRLLREVCDIALAIRRALSRGSQTGLVLLLSALNHVLSIVGMACLALALKITVGWVDFFVLVPFVLLLSMIPISIGGWGLREGIMIAAFGYVGVSRESALSLSLLFGLVTMAVSLPGGVFWLLQRTKVPPTTVASKGGLFQY